MRATSILFVLFLVPAVLLGLPIQDAAAGSPDANRPGPDEVIVHADPYFGAGAAYRFRITPDMRQLTLFLDGHLLNRNFRSVQVGSDVVVNLYRARAGLPTVGFEGHQLLTSTTGLDPRYSILIVNRKSDGKVGDEYRNLPFRVTVQAQWSSFLSPGSLCIDEYFVSQSAKHPTVHELSSVLLPDDQGADHISLRTGRYPSTAIEATLFDQPRAAGSNARTFPTAPANASSYNLWDYGFGDKTRSLQIRWTLPMSGSKTIPGVPVQSAAKLQLLVPNVQGHWQNQLGHAYQIGTNGKKFAWKSATLSETAEGVFLGAIDIQVRWTAADGSKHGPVSGKVERDANWQATRIAFANGLVLTRAASSPLIPSPAANLNGSWNSKYGKVDIQHQGATITGTLHYPGGATASLKGSIQGQTIQVTWFANPMAHGTGTFQISPDGKQLAGPFTDSVSKGSDQWVLTR